jgi:hypothetical protein
MENEKGEHGIDGWIRGICRMIFDELDHVCGDLVPWA